MTDTRLSEVQFGEVDSVPRPEWEALFAKLSDKFNSSMIGGETYEQVRKRVGEFLFDIESRYTGKNILIVTHGTPAWLMNEIAAYTPLEEVKRREHGGDLLAPAAWVEMFFTPYPHNHNFDLDLHRPYIDEVPMGDSMQGHWQRVPDVFDCWFESGSMPYASNSYPKDTSRFNPKKWLGLKPKGYPAHFIAEGIDQTRGWFYSLIVLGVGLFGKTPYQAVITNGQVLAQDGRKMSKKLKNYPDPLEVVEKYGADSVRYYLLSSQLIRGEDLRFTERGVDEISKKLLMRLDNVRSFYELYASPQLASRSPSAASGIGVHVQPVASSHVLDRWVLSRLGELVAEATKGYESYELDNATRPLMDFVDDLSTWYVRRSRDRFKEEGEDKTQALATLRTVLTTAALVMAPVMPFFAEDLYRKIKGQDDIESVHLCAWPEALPVDKELLKEMEQTRKLASVGLQMREKSGMKLRQPLATLKAKIIPTNVELVELLKDELNIKAVEADATLEEEMWLDTELTPELKEEGSVRELVRQVQGWRKEQNMQMSDRPAYTLRATADEAHIAKKYKTEIMSQTGLSDLLIEEA